MSLLGTAPEVVFDQVYPFENRYVTYLARLVEHMAEPADSLVGWDNSILLEGESHLIGPIPFATEIVRREQFQRAATRHLWTALSESIPRPQGVERYYAEKSWGRGLTLLTDAGITSRVINLVRDPRDVVASIRAFDTKRGTFGFGRQAGQSDADYLRWIVDVMKRNLDDMRTDSQPDAMWLRYEDMVTDLPGVTDRLSERLEINLEPAQAVRRARDHGRHVTSRDPNASIGRWRSDLSTSEIEYIEAALSDRMQALGYET